MKNNHNILAADSILLSESQLSSQDNTVKYKINNYNAYCLDQVNTVKPYHSLMAYTYKNINITKITMYAGNMMKAISIFIKKSTKELNIIALYNSPHTTAPHLYAFMDLIMKESVNVPKIIVGHFNINTPENNNAPLCNYMKINYNCDQYVKEYTTKYQTTIDLVFSNYPYKNVSTIDCYWSDHKMVYTVIDDSHNARKIFTGSFLGHSYDISIS